MSKLIGRRHSDAWLHRDAAERPLRPVVQPVDFLARKALEQAVVEHGARAAEPFFRRLKDQHDRAGKRTGRGEISGGIVARLRPFRSA